jgi:hypothetical protein
MDNNTYSKANNYKIIEDLQSSKFEEPSEQILNALRKFFKLNTGISLTTPLQLSKVRGGNIGIYYVDLTSKISGAVAMNLVKNIKLQVSCTPMGLGGYSFNCKLVYSQPNGGLDSYDLGTAYFENGKFYWK